MLSRLAPLALGLALAGPAAAQQTAQDAGEAVPSAADRMVGEEYGDLMQDEQIAIFNEALKGHIDMLASVAPGLLSEGQYRFDGDKSELKDLIFNLSIFRDEIRVGGRYRDVLVTQIANTEDLLIEIRKNPTYTQEDRETYVARLQSQLGDLRVLRDDLNKIDDAIRQFVQIDAPAMEEQYRLTSAINRNAVVIEEFTRLKDTVRSILAVVSPEKPPVDGTD